MLTVEQLGELTRQDGVRTVVVGFTDHYGRLVGKRYDAELFLESVHSHGTHACDYLFTTDMEMTPVPGYQFANWSSGYGDVHLVPDLATLRVASWLDKTALVLCDVKNARDEYVVVAPRSILRHQLQRAQARSFATAA